MAKPDLKNGYIQLAHDLFAALMVAPLPKEARIVLFEVFAQIYGYEKAKEARLSPTEIARRTGMAKPNVARGIAFLLKNGVLRREGLDAFRFVKDYESWGEPGMPLIPPRLAGYAASAPDLAGPPRGRNGGRRMPDSGRNPVIESDNPETDASEYQPEADVDRLSKNVANVIETDNAVPYMETEKVVVVEVEGPTETSSLSESESDNATPRPSPRPRCPRGPDGKPLLWSMAPFKHDPAEVERIADLCAALVGPNEDTIPGNVRRNAVSYPLWYFPYSIRMALALGTSGKLWAYAFGVIRKLWNQGIIDEPEEAPDEIRPARLGVFPPSQPPRRETKLDRLKANCDSLDIA